MDRLADHAYKPALRKLFRRLDGVVRLEYRELLRSRGGAVSPAGHFADPSRFPPNLAFTSRHLHESGLVSLENIQRNYDRARAPVGSGATAEMALTGPAELEISLALRSSGRLLWRGRLMIPAAETGHARS